MRVCVYLGIMDGPGCLQYLGNSGTCCGDASGLDDGQLSTHNLTTQHTFFGRSCQRDGSIVWGGVLADAWLVAEAVCVTHTPPCHRQGGVCLIYLMMVGGDGGGILQQPNSPGQLSRDAGVWTVD